MIKIQDGCDRYCSYCIVPYARGKVKSKNPEEVIEEIKQIEGKGIREIVITGIHLASYGKDFRDNNALIKLLEKINETTSIKRIRLSSLEPTLITEEFASRLKKVTKICNHFHLSLQSGCNTVLARMNRKYNTSAFEKSVKILRKEFPDCALTTDIIVGFPGETDEEFETTYKYLEKINFYQMHIFKYSPRNGTKAATMPMQIDGKIKEERSNKLIKLSNKGREEFNKKYIGREVEVLFEEADGEDIKGHTTNYMLVYVNKKYALENEIKWIKIEKVEGDKMVGKVAT